MHLLLHALHLLKDKILQARSLLVAIISNYRVVYHGKILRNYSGLLWQGISIFSLLAVCSIRSKNHPSQSHLLVQVALRTCGGLDNLKRFMLPFQMMKSCTMDLVKAPLITLWTMMIVV
ncbi:unnamed protein product [Fraxinus pennsylvanica]|uniref:Uncharacterized protein n=1 Tax=Fraxinus pennsylvanica TaxID=56036 RepID=A0AAD2DKG8_9LAMI|nr:unnamed protein product [Fraxinus pennsylvanica]